MAKTKQLRLGAFMRPVSIHTAAWRYPGGTPDANFNFQALMRFAQTLERGKFDAFFMADHLAVLNMPMEALKRSATVTSFDPLTLLPALAMHDRASRPDRHRLDHLRAAPTPSPAASPRSTTISGGRAGWNLVTTSNPDAALNFGMDEQMEHAERYRPRPRVLRRRHRPVGFVGRRRLHPRRRERHLLRSGQAPCAGSQGQVSQGARARSTSRGRSRAGR